MTITEWLEYHLKKSQNSKIKAYNFNLYEEPDEDTYTVQLVGCDEYTPDDDDWATSEIYSSEEDLIEINAKSREIALKEFDEFIKDFLENNENASILKNKHLAYGFVDADLTYLF